MEIEYCRGGPYLFSEHCHLLMNFNIFFLNNIQQVQMTCMLEMCSNYRILLKPYQYLSSNKSCIFLLWWCGSGNKLFVWVNNPWYFITIHINRKYYLELQVYAVVLMALTDFATLAVILLHVEVMKSYSAKPLSTLSNYRKDGVATSVALLKIFCLLVVARVQI